MSGSEHDDCENKNPEHVSTIPPIKMDLVNEGVEHSFSVSNGSVTNGSVSNVRATIKLDFTRPGAIAFYHRLLEKSTKQGIIDPNKPHTLPLTRPQEQPFERYYDKPPRSIVVPRQFFPCKAYTSDHEYELIATQWLSKEEQRDPLLKAQCKEFQREVMKLIDPRIRSRNNVLLLNQIKLARLHFNDGQQVLSSRDLLKKWKTELDMDVAMKVHDIMYDSITNEYVLDLEFEILIDYGIYFLNDANHKLCQSNEKGHGRTVTLKSSVAQRIMALWNSNIRNPYTRQDKSPHGVTLRNSNLKKNDDENNSSSVWLAKKKKKNDKWSTPELWLPGWNGEKHRQWMLEHNITQPQATMRHNAMGMASAMQQPRNRSGPEENVDEWMLEHNITQPQATMRHNAMGMASAMQQPRNRSGPEENVDALPNEVSYILHFFIYC